jgi:hypothetical protein
MLNLLETIGLQIGLHATPFQLKLDFNLSDSISEVNIGVSILARTIEFDPIGWKTSPNIEY